MRDKPDLFSTNPFDIRKRSNLEPEVIEKIAKALDIPEEAITELGEATSINIFSGTWQDNANCQNYNPTFTP